MDRSDMFDRYEFLTIVFSIDYNIFGVDDLLEFNLFHLTRTLFSFLIYYSISPEQYLSF